MITSPQRFYNWFYSWAITYRIKWFEPETYRALTTWTDEDFTEDFIEVSEPE